MPGPNLEPHAPLAPQFVAQLREEYRRHKPDVAEGRVCRRCGEHYPCDTRSDIYTRLVSSGYKPEATALDERLRLADELYLIAHDDVTGKQRRPARVVGTGLGAALLAELMLAGNIRIWGGTVVALDGPAPLDEVSWQVLQQIGAEQDRLPVRAWIEYLAQEAAGRVAPRLGQQQILRPQHTRKVLRATVRWEPVNWTACAWRAGRLRTLLEERYPIELPDLVLIELTLAIGLDEQVLADLGPRAHTHQQTQAGHLRDEFRALATITREVAAAALLNHH